MRLWPASAGRFFCSRSTGVGPVGGIRLAADHSGYYSTLASALASAFGAWCLCPDSHVVRQLELKIAVTHCQPGQDSAGSPAIVKPGQFCRFSRAHLGSQALNIGNSLILEATVPAQHPSL